MDISMTVCGGYRDRSGQVVYCGKIRNDQGNYGPAKLPKALYEARDMHISTGCCLSCGKKILDQSNKKRLVATGRGKTGFGGIVANYSPELCHA